jgi:hypothetical protein
LFESPPELLIRVGQKKKGPSGADGPEGPIEGNTGGFKVRDFERLKKL